MYNYFLVLLQPKVGLVSMFLETPRASMSSFTSIDVL